MRTKIAQPFTYSPVVYRWDDEGKDSPVVYRWDDESKDSPALYV